MDAYHIHRTILYKEIQEVENKISISNPSMLVVAKLSNRYATLVAKHTNLLNELHSTERIVQMQAKEYAHEHVEEAEDENVEFIPEEDTRIILNEDGSVRKKQDGVDNNLYHLELHTGHQAHLQIWPKEKENGELEYPINTTDIINLAKLIIRPKHYYSTASAEQQDDESDLAKIVEQVHEGFSLIQSLLASFKKAIKETSETVSRSSFNLIYK